MRISSDLSPEQHLENNYQDMGLGAAARLRSRASLTFLGKGGNNRCGTGVAAELIGSWRT
eukprot:9483379-Pyramimonas_sp.AAC.1